jgi:hypothetical protein
MTMRIFVTTAAMMAALTVSAFAESNVTGAEAIGEADGSFKMSAQDPTGPILQGSLGQSAMAQADLPSQQKIKGKKASKAKGLSAKGASSNASAKDDAVYNDTGYSAESLKSPTGMDGGNRK